MNNKINYLEKIEISNLWNRFDVNWHLNPDVNILAGINGSGKSSILDCIAGLISIGKIPDNLEMVDEVKLFLDNKQCIYYKHITIKDSIRNIEKIAKNGNPEYKKLLSHIKENEGKDFKKIRSISADIVNTSFQDSDLKLADLHELLNIDIISTFDNSLKQSEAVKTLSDDSVKTELDWEIYHLQKKYLDYQLNISKRKDAIIDENKNIVEEITNIKLPQNTFLNIINESFSDTGKKINPDKYSGPRNQDNRLRYTLS